MSLTEHIEYAILYYYRLVMICLASGIFTCTVYSDGVTEMYIEIKQVRRCLTKKEKMQPYQHVSAKGNSGAVTVSTINPHEKFVVLGASCLTSATMEDGSLSSFTVVPSRADEVVALAIIAFEGKLTALISEVLLLHVTLDKGKACINLRDPFASAAKSVGQMIVDKQSQSCSLRVIESGNTLYSTPWYVGEKVLPSDAMGKEMTQHSTVGYSFDLLCTKLAEA